MKVFTHVCWRSVRRGIGISLMASLALCAWSAGQDEARPEVAASPVDVSVKYILAADSSGQGLQIISTTDGTARIISQQNTASYGACLSPDETKVGYKAINDDGTQSALIYDVASGETTVLATAELVGTPAFSASGHTAYTVGNRLIVENRSGQKRVADLGHHVNLVTLSPDGNKVVYNDDQDQLNIVNLQNGKHRKLTNQAGTVYFSPEFSPDGKRVSARTLTGDVVVISVGSGKLVNLGSGDSPGWLDRQTLGIVSRTTLEGIAVEDTALKAVPVNGKPATLLASTRGDARAAVDNGKFAWVTASGSSPAKAKNAAAEIQYGLYHKGAAVTGKISASLAAISKGGTSKTRDVVDGGTTKYLSNVPFIHQNNDSPDWWNGNWSCNATAALMGIQYYNILPKNPITATWPTPHTSDYGWYIPNTYTWNGQTFNKISYDPNGTVGRGGYGYITQNSWEDTKTHMAEFISYHGPTSGVDWSPTIAEARAEIDSNRPFVILTSITTSGHYKLCIGYVKNQHTLIFNDPYGNKNTGYYPSADGRNVRYDWPGYNNGYSNLVTVHCYIWCRYVQPAAPSNLTATAVSTSKINLAWTDNSSCEANYLVLRGTASGGPYTQVASLAANTTSYSNTGLAANTTYYYVVRAQNPSGSSANSNQASAKTLSNATTIIVDNSDAGFSASTNWSTGTSAADKYGSNYRFRATEAVSDAATWNFNIVAAGNYAISAWWSQGSNRSATATYILPDSTTSIKNQQSGGGAWQSLGTKNLAVGTATVRLSCWTTPGYVVVADAVRVVPQ